MAAVLRPGELLGARIGGGYGATGGSVSVLSEVRTTRGAVHNRTLELLAGRAAEEVLLGDFSGGSGGSADSDLAAATCLAAALETALGLGEGGPVWLGLPTSETVGPVLASSPALAARVRAWLDETYSETVALLEARRDAVTTVARCLLAARSLTGDEVAEIVGKYPPPGVAMG